MKPKSLFDELIEDKELDGKIIKSFKPKDHLSKEIFEKDDDGYVLREDIRKRLIDVASQFMDFVDIEFFIHDIHFTGSLANYNWSEFSDIDLHILVDFEDSNYPVKLLKEFFDSKRHIWNESHDIKIKGYEIEIYVQDSNEKHISSGVYSVLHNKWIVVPEPTNPKIDDRKILEKGEEYANAIDFLIKNKDKNTTPTKIDALKQKIKTLRQSGLENGGEFSYENLTFKLLRRNGYIEKLMNLKTSVIDNKLSITE
jgi:hypothetical protein